MAPTTLQECLERKKNEIGLVGTRLSFSRPKQGSSIEEHITPDWKEIVIRVREDINLCPDEETRDYLQRKGAEAPLETLATDLLYHGCGHRELPVYTGRGCPHTVKNHDQIKDGIAKALKEKGKSGLEAYVANAFEDVLDNVNVRKHTSHIGQILFWNQQGVECESGKYPAFYEAFVKINLNLMGSVADAGLLKRFYTNDKPVQNAVRQFKDYLKGKLGIRNLVKLYDKDDLVRKLFDRSVWKEMAYQFALATAELLEPQQQMPLCFGMPADGNPFDKEMKLPGTQEDLAEGRYKAGEGPSEHTDPLLQLDALYRKISRAIPVQTSEYTQASKIPIAYHGRRDPHEDETIRLRRIKGIGFNEQGELGIKLARHELHHPATYKIHPQKFPKLKIALVDTSGSMGEAADGSKNVGDVSFIPWGDRSKYHYALKGIYGIDNFLERQGISQYVESEVVTIAGSPERTSKGKLRNEQERRALLQKPSGGTTLNPALLRSDGKAFVVSISDGDIQNWASVKEDYKKAIKNADYCHIHLGAANAFTQDLESWGIKVKFVSGDDDLSRLLLDVTSVYYKRGNFT
ncbi:hypothetical protein HZC30_01760 [Candidatus Woesearchaeota archaeon]|nr:hypothetical protein [Candidatus Woesearchaeota archaeon]